MRAVYSPMLLPQERRLVFMLVLVAFVLRAALALRSEPFIYSRPYIDDTFYALGCASHLAHGDGLTSDGHHPTNGIQPLIVFLDAPLFWIAGSDKTLGVRLTLVFEALIDACALWLFASLIARMRRSNPVGYLLARAPIIGALLWLGLFNVFRQQMNGLETGLYSLGILATLHYYTSMRREKNLTMGRWAILGVMLGLLVLARIDAVFLILGIIAIELWRRRRSVIAPLALMGGVSIVVSSPWWIYNTLAFGSIMPQSGQSEALGVHFGRNIYDGAVALADIVVSFFYFPYQEFPAWSRWLWCIAAGVFLYWFIRCVLRSQKLRESYDLSALAPLAIASIGYIAFYVFFFAAWWFLYRYFQPIRLLWTILLAIGLERLFEHLATLSDRRKMICAGLISLGLLGAFIFNANRYIANFTTDDIYPGYLVGKWANARPSLKIGMEQSGTAAFVADNITNLDGKVNPDALAARKAGMIGQYIAQTNFDYLIDWEIIVAPLAAKATAAGVPYVRDSSFRTMLRYRRSP